MEPHQIPDSIIMATVSPICYFKRYRMEIDLARLPAPRLPEGYQCIGWRPDLLEVHAAVLHGCFKDEIDATVFPSLGDPVGCIHLMTEIVRRSNFVPEATWLLAGPEGAVGTVQALRERGVSGAIQNIGVLPGWRGRGLGRGLLLRALHGFYQTGLGRAQLEVTAQNEAALCLYSRLGFRRSRTIYKAVALAHPL
jgi:GNAT superfamily N-acetyltransferase